jgi:hypothetical protein
MAVTKRTRPQVGGTFIEDMYRESARERAKDAFLQPGPGEPPPGTCMVTVTLRFCGGESTRTIRMPESRLRPEVVKFFDPLAPADGLVAIMPDPD